MPEIEKSVGFKTEPLPVAWNSRDLLLYAVRTAIRLDATRSCRTHILHYTRLE